MGGPRSGPDPLRLLPFRVNDMEVLRYGYSVQG